MGECFAKGVREGGGESKDKFGKNGRKRECLKRRGDDIPRKSKESKY